MMIVPSENEAESPDRAAEPMGTAPASAVATAAPLTGDGPDPEASAASPGRHLSGLGWSQVKRLDALLSEPIPIHGRGNFPTLSVSPRQVVQVRRAGRGCGFELSVGIFRSLHSERPEEEIGLSFLWKEAGELWEESGR